jgi:PAS domain S-box-containing protein
MARAMASIERHQQQTDAWLTDASAVANALESRLIDTTTELERLREDSAAEREASIAARAALDEQLRQSKAMLDAEIESHVAEIDRMAARLADNEERSSSRLAQAATAIKVAESKRAEAIAALNRVVQQATAERQAASTEAAERQAQFKADLAREAAQRNAVERELTESRTMAAAAERRYADALAAAQEHARNDRARLEQCAADERAEWERVRLVADGRISDLEEQLRQTREALTAAADQVRQLSLDYEEAQADSARRQDVADREIAQLRAERDGLQQSLDHTRITADETLARLSQDRSVERARLEAIAADLEAQLNELMGRMQASERAAASRLSESERRLGEMQSARNRSDETVAQLEHQLKEVRDQLDAARKRGEQMRAAAERVPLLEHELDSLRADHRRQFEDNPASWLRCRRSGEVLHANRSMSSLLGYEDGELTRLDFGRAVFDSANDFRWMVDRCLTSMSMQSMETPWRQKHGGQIIVRLIAVPTTPDAVDLVAEDITQVRELEEKLRHAQRMEAVARYGSEVAVTCQGLLSHVKEEGQQWLAGIESDTVRYRGELLLEEVTRATAYLTQLATYSEEQQHVPALVDVNKVLRDLAPVLKRVAGEDIDVVLPKLSMPLNLDVDARPVERMLVNVAAYGRERMPLGGRLKIDVDSVVVDREFVSKHPHVRPGEHVLLTVNEQRRAVRPERVDGTGGRTAVTASTFTGDSPGVDLGALQALVSECGGHLWMRAEPPGDMELKIHLPRRVLDRLDPAAAPISPVRSRWIRRAFGARH